MFSFRAGCGVGVFGRGEGKEFYAFAAGERFFRQDEIPQRFLAKEPCFPFTKEREIGYNTKTKRFSVSKEKLAFYRKETEKKREESL